MALPDFRYHPNPIESCSIIESDEECACCGQSRGYLYAGPVYSIRDLADAVCPWCIAEGIAHRRFGATFVDEIAFQSKIPDPVRCEITQRTPGFNSWQTEQWPCCCGDATAFLIPAGIAELREQSALEGFALQHIVYEMGISGGAAKHLLESLDRDFGPTAYVFQCLHCRRYVFHIDHA